MKSYVAYIFLGGPKNDRFRINIYDNRYYQDYLQDVSYSETYKCLLQKDISSIDGKILVENFNFKQSSLHCSVCKYIPKFGKEWVAMGSNYEAMKDYVEFKNCVHKNDN